MDPTKRRLLTIVAVLGAVVLLATGCASGSNASGAKKSITVGAIYLDTQGFYGGVQKGAQEGAKSAGRTVKVLESNAQDDASKESTFVNTFVSAQVDALLLSASSSTGSIPAVRQASKGGVPVICYNTCVSPAATKQYVYAYIVGDPVKFGKMLGDAAADYFVQNKIANPTIGVLNCEFVQVCVQRRQGFESALKAKVPGYKIVSNQQATDPTKSIDTATNILTAHPDLTAFFGESGGATVGGVKAVENTGHAGKTVVFGGDMTTDIANDLVDGSVLKAEVDISGLSVGKLAIAEAIKAVDGKKKPSNVDVQAPIKLYVGAQAGKDWLTAHADGTP
ncbi:MAG: sugar transporter substrate-binding protein [Microbacteriaceae bacterium]|nr:sugar transporter substrate-binding protein [Microbacteriaceae bacterium]